MVRFSDEWLESEEFRRHMDRLHAGCSKEFSARMFADGKAYYSGLSMEDRARMFEIQSRRAGRREAEAADPLKPGQMRKEMEDLLHRWENGLHDFSISYPGGPVQLRRDLEDGKFDR